MPTKPLKRHESILTFSREHHFSLLFCWKIRQGIKKNVAGERIREYVQYFWDNCLQSHFRQEEAVLFAPLQDKMVQRAVLDHQYISKQITALAGSSAKDLPKDLAILADSVDNHVRYEERELFPYLERKLSKEQLAAIGEQLADEPLKDDYRDEFWNWPATL